MKRHIARFFAVWLFLGSLFPQTDLEELCKVPMLWIHYQTEHAELSLNEFLQLHYGSKAGEDCPAHDSLPMQKHAHTCQSILFVPLEVPFVLPAPLSCTEPIAFVAFRQDHYRFQPENALFSPPKVAV
jgi:hypothetical protein